jgi:hypothetical protein
LQRAAANRCSPSYATYLDKSVRVGTANVVLMNRSIVSPGVHDRLPQLDQLPSDIADDTNTSIGVDESFEHHIRR